MDRSGLVSIDCYAWWMKRTSSQRTAMPQSLFVKAVLPFAAPILLTFALVLLVGNHWPRDIAPGSGLKLAGLIATAATAFVAWRYSAAQLDEPKACKFAALLCAVTALLGWPVWSVGVLPSVNGAIVRGQSTVHMTLERTEVTHASKSRKLYYWAWLKPDQSDAVIGSGRYFISEDVYNRLEKTSPATVKVTVGQGLLGARIVLGYDQR
ncbi:hypothetical protein IP81_09585 [Novosphingobium sp. AAP83]|nr:hypothetical protein IP81_09585 [Novosphingobium sp. AAP83]